jgi:hypothetical protein
MSPHAHFIRCQTLIPALVTTMLLTLAVSAQAQPADIHAPLARTATANARAQDLRHLRAGATPGATYTSGATAGGQYTPGATAAQPPTRRQLVGPPIWPVNPQPISPAHAVKASDNSGSNPTTIGFGIAGSLLALACLVGIARRTRHRERTRVSV